MLTTEGTPGGGGQTSGSCEQCCGDCGQREDIAPLPLLLLKRRFDTKEEEEEKKRAGRRTKAHASAMETKGMRE